MPLFTRASEFGVHGGSFTDVARDSVHVHVEAQQASFEMPGSSCSRKRKRDLDKDKDDDHLQIVKRRRLAPQSVLTHGSSYELHLARQSGRIVVVKVFGGPRAEERFAANLTSCRRHLHPNVGQMIGRSPDDSESPFIIYRCAESTNRLHPIIAKALRTDLLRSIHLAMRTVKGFAAGIDYLNRQGFPLQNSLSLFLDILVGDNDEPLIVVNPGVAALGDGFPSNNGNHGWAVFSSLCRETFREVNTILYDDTPKRNHVDYESSSRPETLTTGSATLGAVENDNLELSSSSTLTLAQPNKPRRELWWIDPGHTYPSLNSIARRFDDFLASIPSSSSPPLRRFHNSEEGKSLHQCPGYLREEIVLGSDLARSAIISHSTPNAMERCSVCGELVPSGAGSEEETALSGAQQSQNPNPNPNQPSQNQNPDHRYPTNDPAFSSAFGLMSLDDPAVLAGLASDAQPFFTPHDLGVKMEEPDPDTTPLGHPAESSSTGGNAQPPGSDPGQGQRIKDEADSRAVRELWGQYISTPFSGPHSALEGHDTSKNMSTTGVHRNGSLNIHGHGSPSWLPYKRQRVNSLPSAGRTPVQARYPGQDKNQHHQNINPSTLRTVHNLEDLHSYEAAVRSRVPPTQLRLPNRKRSVGDKSPTGVESKSADTSPMVPARAYSVGGAASSSLAHAFSFGADMEPPFVSRGKNGGRDRDKQQQEQKQRVKLESHGSRSVSSSSRESSLGVEDRMSVGSRSRSGSGSGGERLSMRPSFKRLPSQTLEPVTSKRALLVHHRDQEGEDGAADEGGGGGAGVGVGVGWGLQAKLHLGGSRSLADRRRRMSCAWWI